MYDLGYKELLADITARFGITLTYSDSSRDNALIWETRLETGEWIWITDYDAGITDLDRRRALEEAGITVGWHVGIYANQITEQGDDIDSCTRLAGVEHFSATAEELPDLIELALGGRARHEQHTFKADEPHTVEYGIRTY